MASRQGADVGEVDLKLRYYGPALERGRMDVYDVAKNMTSFSDFVKEAAKQHFGDTVEVSAEVDGFSEGSFETELAFHIAGASATLLSVAPDLPGLLSLISEGVEFMKFLRGEPPRSMVQTSSNAVNVQNNSGTMNNFQLGAVNLMLDQKAGEAIAQFVGEALSRPGVSGLDVAADGSRVVTVNDDEAAFFKVIDYQVSSSTHLVEMHLRIEALGFRDGLKWRFNDGADSFTAEMRDKDFMNRIDQGEAFRKGDVLFCQVEIAQSMSLTGRLKAERAITRVIRHAARSMQSGFEFPDEE